MKNKTIYLLLVIMLFFNITSVAEAVQSAGIPEGYQRLSDIGTYGIIDPNAENILIPKELADKLEGNNIGIQYIQKIEDQKSKILQQQNPQNSKPKSSFVINIPESKSSGAYILSSATVTFSPNVTKLWNKTYAGDIFEALTIPDITGDNLDDAVVVVYYPADSHYALQVIKGTNGQILWTFPTAPNTSIYWNIVPDVDSDGAKDVLLVTTKSGMLGSDYTVYMKKGTTGATLWQDTTLQATSVTAQAVPDLNGDNIPDVLIEKSKSDMSTWPFKSVFEVVAKKGRDGIKLWNDSTSTQETIYGFADATPDLNGDKLADVLIEKFISGFTGLSSFEVKAKVGKNGTQLWKDATSVKGSVYGFAYPIGELNKDNLTDILIEKFGTNTSTGVSFLEVKANVGKNGAQLWKDATNVKNGYVGLLQMLPLPVGDVNSDGVMDIFFDKVTCGTSPCSNGSVVNRTLKVIKGNNGVPVWQQFITSPSGWEHGFAFPIGDMNKDGLLDLFYQNYKKNLSSTTDYILTNKVIQAKNGASLWSEDLHGKYNQHSVMPYYAVSDLNGDTYNDLLMEYNDNGNITLKVRKGPAGSLLWSAPFTKSSSTEQIDIYPMIMQDINGDGLSDVLIDVDRTKPASQSDTLQARIGKNGSLKWQDSINGTAASFDLNFLGDANGDGVSDYIINGYNTSATKKTYLYKIKNMKTGSNLWAESLPTGIAATYGEMYACAAGDLKGNGKENILKYTHTAANSYSMTAKIAPAGASLWQITSNKDINACSNTYSNFNGDTKDDILFTTYRDIYAITTN